MMYKSIWIVILLLLGMYPFSGIADGQNEQETMAVPMIPFGLGTYQTGQLNNKNDDRDHLRWNQVMVGLVGVDAEMHERLQVLASIRVKRWLYAEPEHELYTEFGFGEMYGNMAIGGTPDNPMFNTILGLSHYKYNPDACHLGEYLLRSGAYPPFITTDFDFPKFEAFGVRLGATHFDEIFKQDIMLTSERLNRPHGDYSLSYLAGVKPASFIEFGGGISFSRIFPMSKKVIESQDLRVDSNGVPLVENGDSTLYYTMQGTKLMARIQLDPKGLFPSQMFTEQDLKLYAEAALLGVKDYTPEYSDRMERLPIMVGFHFPTFGILDVLAFEAEYYKQPKLAAPNEYLSAITAGETKFTKEDDWRWAVYAKRQVMENLSISGIVTSDHWRLEVQEGGSFRSGYLNERAFTTKNWYWRVRITWGINSNRASYKE
ncbi:MAG: hypothetical protein HQK83_12130 [Fibrobacteria bacterium]|nr:hypothetical protein [Fibrobacteria bacterium]